MPKDWNGNSKALFSTLSASNHSDEERETNDYYATPPQAVEDLLKRESFSKYIVEPAVGGGGHIAKVLKAHNHIVTGYDIVDRGYEGTIVKSWFDVTKEDIKISPDIITNPPYSMATEFVQHALDISMDSVKIAMFLKIQFLESQKRYELFKAAPPKKVYVYVNRMECAKNGEFTNKPSAACYCWFIWEKGYKGLPQIDWIADDTKVTKKKLF